jgi:flagellar hook-length control protein FliK
VPEISSLPAWPGVRGPAPAAGVPAATPVLPGASSFLAQLKTALAGLTGVTLPGSQVTATQVTAPVTDEDQLVAEDEGGRADDHTADVMPEVLASLGFLPVPPLLQPQVTTATASPGASAGAKSIEAPLERPFTQTAEGAVAASTSAADTLAQSKAEDAAPQPLADHLKDAAQPLDALPADVKSAVDQLVQNTAQQQAVATPTSAPHKEAHPASPTPSTAVDLTAPAQGVTPQQLDANTGDTSGGDGSQHSALATEDVIGAETVSPQARAEAMAAGVTTTAPIAGAALPTHVRPSEVVNQIAHQADLYRLPGNKGVRIQLHPDDLGGVDVTLRYTANAGIQLHINVEHASTGSLVQAGWNDLRDALASQGITPDRLVMSVSGPGDASGLNFSFNGNGNANDNGANGSRADAGLASFGQGQGQSGGQAQDGEPRRVNRGWFGDTDQGSSVSPVEDTSRSALASARIDYRV